MVTIDLENLDELTIIGDNFETVILKTRQLRFFEARPLSGRQTYYSTIYDFQESKIIEHLKIVKGALSLRDIDKQFELMGQLVNISTLDLNSNAIYEIPSGLFRSIPSLQSLYLNSNGLSAIYSDTFTGLVYLTMLNLEDNSITSIAHDFLHDMKMLTNLQLSSNDLSSINDNVFSDTKMLTTLTLSDNDLSWLNENLFANTKVLATLTLADNRFVGFNRTTFIPIYSSLKSIDMSGNVLVCNCESKWIVEKLGGSLINKDQTICSTTGDTLEPLRGKPIEKFKPSDYCGLNVTLISSLVSTGLAVLGILVICFHHRWLLKYKFFLLKLAILGYREIQDNHDREDFEYDINVMFMDDDKDFAETIFMPALRERLPHHERIAFGDQNLLLGMHYLDAVYRNVEKSFKTILLISRAALQDHIFMTKFRIAVNHVTDTQAQNLILVLLEDIPEDEELPHLLRLYLSGQGAYLRWQENEQGQKQFWDKVTKHLAVNLRVNHMIPPY